MRVQATAPGFYNGRFRNIGDVFDLNTPGDYVAFNVSLVPAGNPNYPMFGWMMQVSSSAALVDQTLVQGGQSVQPQETVGTNQGGQKVYGQAAGLGNNYVV